MQITIKAKDIKKTFSDSGQLIDELAYSIDAWTSNELYENNFDYEPVEPYEFNFEKDLLENTKTSEQLVAVVYKALGMSVSANITTLAEKAGLQCGAWIALNNDELFQKILTAYTEALKEDDQTLSKDYTKELEEAKESFNNNLYYEWLNGDRGEEGIISRISKYYTETRHSFYDKKSYEYTFVLSEYDIQEYKDRGYKSNQMKRAILDAIEKDSYNRQEKEKVEREKRQEKREREKKHLTERTEREKQERSEKLSKLTII